MDKVWIRWRSDWDIPKDTMGNVEDTSNQKNEVLMQNTCITSRKTTFQHHRKVHKYGIGSVE